MSKVILKPIQQSTISVVIEGISPLIQHNWDEKSKRQMREKHAGKKTKEREVRDPKSEFTAAMYVTEDGKPGIPAVAIKSAMVAAAHKDIGVEKTLMRKAIFIRCQDANGVIELQGPPPKMREDVVRVGMGSTDLRYRPEFTQWEAQIVIDYDEEMMQIDTIINLLNRAGFGVGIGEWRPEKDGQFGRFRVKTQ